MEAGEAQGRTVDPAVDAGERWRGLALAYRQQAPSCTSGPVQCPLLGRDTAGAILLCRHSIDSQVVSAALRKQV